MVSKTTRLDRTGPPADALERAQAYASLWFGDHGLFRYFYNRPFPVSDEMWRCNQPSPGQIKTIADMGIRTVINLRGPSKIWAYRLEREACERHGLTMIDFRVKSRDAPYKEVLHAADEMFRTIEYPAIMHCKSGADRVGIMSALYLMMRKGEPVEKAMEQLSLRFGHIRQAKTGMLDHFLETYAAYNRRNPMPFLQWVDEVYDLETMRASFRDAWLPSLIVDRVLRRE